VAIATLIRPIIMIVVVDFIKTDLVVFDTGIAIFFILFNNEVSSHFRSQKEYSL
jgi:hypothetical protein